MGVCSSDGADPEEIATQKKDRNTSRNIDTQLAESHANQQQVNKLLLLGAGASGKSTLFKQMITIYGKGFQAEDRMNYDPVIANNIIVSMRTLCMQCEKYGKVEEKNQPAHDFITALAEDHTSIRDTGDTDGDLKVGDAIKQLWGDKGIQATYLHRSKYYLNDSANYYFDEIEEIMADGYIPSDQDVLRSRVPTTGIVENTFDIDGNLFKMFDVGGQRSERKKWIHCFENVTAVLFVAALSAYDQVLYESENTNRMVEAMELFDEITNSEWFFHTSIILFLNKRDLFQEKIKTVPLKKWFPDDFEGDDTYENGLEFIRNQFLKLNLQEKDIYTHYTCATDTTNVYMVFNSVKDIVIKKGLLRAGLM